MSGSTMHPSRVIVVRLLVGGLLLSWLMLILVWPLGPGWLEHVLVGYLIGTIFGQATVASAWTALGPLPLAQRLPLSLGWNAALVIAFSINPAANGPGGKLALFLIVAASIAAQWLIIQIPLWGLAIAYGLRLRHEEDPPEAQTRRQFGIRQLMIVTAIVAVLLGVGRAVFLASLPYLREAAFDGAAVFGVLMVAGIIMTLPLLLAALLPGHNAWAASAVVLALIAAGTWYELPLLQLVPTGPGGGPNEWHLAFINAFQAAWVLGIAGVMRWLGYGIGPSGGKLLVASKA
jgi:hypothetical protein